MRSTQTPAGSVKRMNGRKPSTPISATSNALASSTTMATKPIARSSTAPPNWLIVSADQSFRKSRWRQSPPVGQSLGIPASRGEPGGCRKQREREGVHLSVRILGAVEIRNETIEPFLEAPHVPRRQTGVQDSPRSPFRPEQR